MVTFEIKNLTKAFGSLLLLMLFSSCASLTERGHEALRQGEYEKALSLFQQATTDDELNSEAKEGLRLAQQMWLNRKLIDVRLLRLGGNFGDSESLLLQIIKSEGDWQVFPSGAAFATQKEEIALFSNRVQSRIEEYLKQSNPLAAQAEFNRNHFILERALAQNLSALQNNIYNQGQIFCMQTLKTLDPREYYTGQWLEKTCQIWKQTLNLPELKNSVTLFRDVKSTATMTTMLPDLVKIMNENLKKAFLLSKWYDPKGKVILDLKVQGSFVSEHSETSIQRTKEYSVQVPYEETFTRIKDPRPRSGVSGAIAFLSLLSGTFPDERVTDNGDGTETVVATKYRTESREHKYMATELIATKRLLGTLEASLDHQAFSMAINQNYLFRQDRHSENFPGIGLSPSNPQFISDEQWIQATSEELISVLSSQLQQRWIMRYCLLGPEKNSDLNEREQMHRCAHQVTAVVPEGLRQYYLKTWQIEFKDWQAMTESK